MRKYVTLAAVASLALVGCGTADSDADVAASTPEPTPQAASTSEATPTPTEPAEPSLNWDNVIAFTEAMDRADGEAMAALVSPRSPAERWLQHWTNLDAVDTAYPSGGEQPETAAAVYDETAGTVTNTNLDGSTTITKDWATDADGLIVSWSDSTGVPIADRLWTQSPSGTGAGQTVTVASAFRTSNGDMLIALDITADTAGYLDYAPTYVGPDGVAREPLYNGPSDITPGAINKAYYLYESADFGGQFVYEASMSVEPYDSATVTLAIS